MAETLQVKSLSLLLLATFAVGALSLPAQERKKGNAEGRVDLESEMPPDAGHLELGDAAPDFKLLGTDGKTYSLADFKAAPVLMVVFLSNHCPYSHAAETRLLPLGTPGTRAFRSRWLSLMPKPVASFSSVMVQVVSMLSAVRPACPSWAESAMEKQPA